MPKAVNEAITGELPMTTIRLALFSALIALVACAPVPEGRIGPDGLPLPQVYRISDGDEQGVYFRFLDGLNALRGAVGAGEVRFSAELNAAAATHARDMALQNRPWHFGSDGSSPLDRVQRVGYPGELVGEAISETYEGELETLGAWAEAPETRGVLLDPQAVEIGLAWYQEPAGKLWWTLVTGRPSDTVLSE
jgi:uncharacterized protein YkwD